MALRILDIRPGACLAALEGELTVYQAAALRGEIERLAREHPVLEIDLAGATDADTAGLQLMLMAKRLAGATVRFVNHSPVVLRLLELSNLARAIGDPLVLLSPRNAAATEEKT
ncbi:MAG: hypothetical protein H6R10_3636 [Rhodocyclaceae bacterium]|nr:hypothetical protein [Rhodocyclaceae bacterium]